MVETQKVSVESLCSLLHEIKKTKIILYTGSNVKLGEFTYENLPQPYRELEVVKFLVGKDVDYDILDRVQTLTILV